MICWFANRLIEGDSSKIATCLIENDDFVIMVNDDHAIFNAFEKGIELVLFFESVLASFDKFVFGKAEVKILVDENATGILGDFFDVGEIVFDLWNDMQELFELKMGGV